MKLPTPPRVRDKYIDLDFSTSCPIKDPLILLKYDGIWGQLEIHGDKSVYEIYSRTGQKKFCGSLTKEQEDYFGNSFHVYRGEFMFGQQWGIKHNLQGKIFLWEKLVHHGCETRGSITALGRYDLCKAVPGFELAERALAPSELMLRSMDFEGYVFVDPDSLCDPVYYRYKPSKDADLIIKGFLPGTGKHQGRLGSLTCMSEDGAITQVGGGFSDPLREEIWNNRESFLGKCITITHKGKFLSGAFRHPNFLKFHQEK